jgi:hypothetical protein
MKTTPMTISTRPVIPTPSRAEPPRVFDLSWESEVLIVPLSYTITSWE